MFVPMADLLEEEFVANALRQAGLTEQEIRAFISASSEEFVGEGELQRAVLPRNRRNISQVVSKDACCSSSA